MVNGVNHVDRVYAGAWGWAGKNLTTEDTEANREKLGQRIYMDCRKSL
jgi:hypothetical protein